jgi:hypothetical protein
MQKPAYLPLYADRYSHFIQTLVFHGKDLTGCALTAKIRDRVNSTTTPVVSLTNQTSTTITGLRLHGVDTSGPSPISTVIMTVLKTDIDDFISSLDEGDVTARYELKIKETDGFTEAVYCSGPFIIRAGVNDA